MGSLSLDCYHSHSLMILKERLTFLSLSNPVLQYTAGYAWHWYEESCPHGKMHSPNTGVCPGGPGGPTRPLRPCSLSLP